jgi:RNA polymerase-binding transcription factor DksA
VSRLEVCVAHPLLAALQADTLRALLLAELGERSHQLAKEATRLAALTINPSKDPTGLDRAMSALHMYGARAAIEEIDDALVRINVGGYGTGQECGRPIPFQRLEAIPMPGSVPRAPPLELHSMTGVASNRSENKHGNPTDR